MQLMPCPPIIIVLFPPSLNECVPVLMVFAEIEHTKHRNMHHPSAAFIINSASPQSIRTVRRKEGKASAGGSKRCDISFPVRILFLLLFFGFVSWQM